MKLESGEAKPPIQKAVSPNQERGGVNKDKVAHVSVNPSCWNRDKRNSLRLLSDELYWSACERVTPTLRVRFAVDGW